MTNQNAGACSADARRAGRAQWTLVGLSVGFCVLGWYLFGLYGNVHWHLTRKVLDLRQAGERLSHTALVNASDDDRASLEKEGREYRELGENCSAALSRHMGALGIYPLPGLAALVFSVVACLGKPRRIGFVSLPFGVAGLLVGVAIM